MSAVIERLIFCDGCAENCDGDDRVGFTFTQMRANRQKHGWIRMGKEDFCPKCAKKLLKL